MGIHEDRRPIYDDGSGELGKQAAKAKMKNHAVFTIFSLLVALTPLPVMAQTSTGCTQDELGDPPRIVYRCVGGMILEAEAASALGIVETGKNARPTDVEVKSDAVFIKLPRRSGPFQIRTPHAIAAVRGTKYVVDVTKEKTAVFVRRGKVIVSRPDGTEAVTLTRGLGADVTPGEPLVARRWPKERVRKLLSRFGR